MDTECGISKVSFDRLHEKYLTGQSISCRLVLENFQTEEGDWVGLYSEDGTDVKEQMARLYIKEANSKTETDENKRQTLTFDFSEYCYAAKLSAKHLFKYVNADLRVIAESNSFEIENGTISSESLVTVQAADSFDDTMVLVNKLSGSRFARMEGDFRKIHEKLVDANKKAEEQDECSQCLQKQLSQKETECDKETIQREQAENAVEELGRRIAEQIHVIEEQGQRIEVLDRNFSRESKLNAALKDDMEAQKITFEESLIEYEQLKVKAINYRTELKRYKKTIQEERELFADGSSKYEEELCLLRQRSKQKITDGNLKLQESELAFKELEISLELERDRRVALERKLKELSKEYAGFMEEKESDMIGLKNQISELQDQVQNEEKNKDRLIKESESTIAELEEHLTSEKAKGSSLLLKCEEMQKRAGDAEEKSAALQLKLEEADLKLHEMEELITGSKSELELLKKTVSNEDVCIHKTSQSDSKIYKGASRENKMERNASLNLEGELLDASSVLTPPRKSYSQAISPTTSTPQNKAWNNNRPREPISTNETAWNKIRDSNAHRGAFNRNNEAGRHAHRYTGRRRFGQQEESFGHDSSSNMRANSKDFHPVPKPGQVRQHRNSLLRENSRLRYSMSLLNHNCAILNYTLQQVVVEAEQKLESVYSMFLEKEAECAAYMSQLQGGALVYNSFPYDYANGTVNYYDQYSVQNSEFPEGHAVGTSFVQNGTVMAQNYPCGYYDAYRQQDGAAQPIVMGQVGSQVQYMQPVYVSQAAPTEFPQT